MIVMNRIPNILENNENQNVNDFYVRFKEKLEETHSFPTRYVFKYILPSDQDIVDKLRNIFDKEDMDFLIKDSKTGKYKSVTIKAIVNDADDVIIYYRQAASIEGIMAL